MVEEVIREGNNTQIDTYHSYRMRINLQTDYKPLFLLRQPTSLNEFNQTLVYPVGNSFKSTHTETHRSKTFE